MNKQPNTNGHIPGLSLSPAAQMQVRLAAQTPGNQLTNVEEVARTDVRAAQHGGAPAAQKHLEATERKKGVEEKNLQEAETRVRHTEPKVIVKGHRHPMGVMGWLIILLLLVGLLMALWVENGAASQVLMSLGAFDVDTIEKARMVMLTPVVVGIALVLGHKVLPVFIRRPFFIGACALLVILFLTWAVCFAIQSEEFRNEASHGLSLSDSFEGTGEDVAKAANLGGWSSWLMFGCLASIMCLTTFIGHTGVEHVIQRYETWVTNGEYSRALDDVKVYENEVNKYGKEGAQLVQLLADLQAQEEQAVVQARTLYLNLSQGGSIPPGNLPPADDMLMPELRPRPHPPTAGKNVVIPTFTNASDRSA